MNFCACAFLSHWHCSEPLPFYFIPPCAGEPGGGFRPLRFSFTICSVEKLLGNSGSLFSRNGLLATYGFVPEHQREGRCARKRLWYSLRFVIHSEFQRKFAPCDKLHTCGCSVLISLAWEALDKKKLCWFGTHMKGVQYKAI